MTAVTTTRAGFRRRGELEVLAWASLDALDVDVMVTTRHGGVSSGPYATLNLGLHVGDDPASVLENRRRVAAALGADLGDFVFCEQSHGNQVKIVSAADRGRGTLRRHDAIGQTDAVVTTDPGTVLVVLVADCVPIVLYDPQAQVLACVHAGWRGTVAGVTGAALHTMRSLGAQPGRILAGIGPAVAADRYQVGAEVAAEAARYFSGDLAGIMRADGTEPTSTEPSSTEVSSTELSSTEPASTGRWLFDLPAANRRLLRESGVPDSQIQMAPGPTGTGPGTGPGYFFSDREARPCGRFAAVARLRPREGE